MNAARRKEIQKILDALSDLAEQIELLRDEEQDAFDNLPEGIQTSERGEGMESAISEMEDAISSIDDAKTSLENSIQN